MRKTSRYTGDHAEVLLKTATLLFQGQTITSEYIRERFGCSKAAAKRLLVTLEVNLPVEVSQDSRKKKYMRMMQ